MLSIHDVAKQQIEQDFTQPTNYAEHNDGVLCGFFVYDFPLNYNNEYIAPIGECITHYTHDKIAIYDYDSNTYTVYTIEQ